MKDSTNLHCYMKTTINASTRYVEGNIYVQEDCGRLPQEADASAGGAHDRSGVADERARVYTALAGLAGEQAAGAVPTMQGSIASKNQLFLVKQE
ncbi:unnamed protein product [Colias eurytheme]|nr:unnamed protein product [Colias eurytheme]